jgi:hypothetical protein
MMLGFGVIVEMGVCSVVLFHICPVKSHKFLNVLGSYSKC